MNVPLFYQYPMWITGLIFLGFLLFALESGFWLGRWQRRRTPSKDRGGTGDIALTAMYGLLGLVLAFTYSFTITRADQRKQGVLAEANALGTAFLRAGLVEEPVRGGLRLALRDYAATRVVDPSIVPQPDQLRAHIERSLREQARLWPLVEQAVQQRSGPIEAGLIQAVNDVIDSHTARIAVFRDRLPMVVLCMLVFIGGASLAVSGYNRGLTGVMNRWRMTALALVLAAVMNTITDFDRSFEGWVTLNQQPLRETVASMDAALAPPP